MNNDEPVSPLTEDRAFSFAINKDTLIELERALFCFQQDRVLLLLEEMEEIRLLLEIQEKLLESNQQLSGALSQSYGDLSKALGEVLCALNKDNPEYVQPGKITE